jgi:hypothetical protein
MCVWFLAIAVLGIVGLAHHPAVLSNAYVYGGNGYASGSAITKSVPMTQTLVAAVLIKWK